MNATKPMRKMVKQQKKFLLPNLSCINRKVNVQDSIAQMERAMSKMRIAKIGLKSASVKVTQTIC